MGMTPNTKGLDSGAVLGVLAVQLPAVQPSAAVVISSDRTGRLCLLGVLPAARHLPVTLQ